MICCLQELKSLRDRFMIHYLKYFILVCPGTICFRIHVNRYHKEHTLVWCHAVDVPVASFKTFKI